MMEQNQAKQLQYGQTIYSRYWSNADGTPQRWRVNGAVKLWKRDPTRIQVPIKRGLWEYSYLTKYNLDEFALTEEDAKGDER
jgi:hypothetical protein